MIKYVIKTPKRKKIFLSLAIVLGIVASVVLTLHARRNDSKHKFATVVKHCNAAASELRFACYKSALENYYHDTLPDLRRWVGSNRYLSFKGTDNSYAIFGTNCHTFYHAVGDSIAERGQGQDSATLVNYCPNTCTSGCVMGLYKRTALINNFETPILEHLWDVCPIGSEHQCTHEIGHILHDKYVFSILRILDDLGVKTYGLEQKTYNYQRTEKPNLNAPFEECKKIVPEEERAYCYTGVGHNLFLFSQFATRGYATLFKECESAATNKDACYDFLIYRIGINDAATQFLSYQFDAGRKVCDDAATLSARSTAKKHCYLGIGGGIGLFLDSEYTNQTITPQNIGAIRKDVLDHIDLCEQSEEEYRTECYKGLLGTRVKKLYAELNLHHLIIEKVLTDSDDSFEVVG